MAPVYDTTFVYEYFDEDSTEDNEFEHVKDPENLTEMVFWYLAVLICMLLTWLLIYFCLKILALSKYYL